MFYLPILLAAAAAAAPPPSHFFVDGRTHAKRILSRKNLAIKGNEQVEVMYG